MRLARVRYQDTLGGSDEPSGHWNTATYPFPKAKQVAENLKRMGCIDVKVVEV